MTKQYDGWIIKDKYGDLWFGTLGREKEDVESHIECAKYKDTYELKIVKVKLMEVE